MCSILETGCAYVRTYAWVLLLFIKGVLSPVFCVSKIMQLAFLCRPPRQTFLNIFTFQSSTIAMYRAFRRQRIHAGSLTLGNLRKTSQLGLVGKCDCIKPCNFEFKNQILFGLFETSDSENKKGKKISWKEKSIYVYYRKKIEKTALPFAGLVD